jgi:hypothetical protein
MINRALVKMCTMALLFAGTACLTGQGGQRVPQTFVYPDAPEIMEYQAFREVKSLSGIVRDLQHGIIADALVEGLSDKAANRLEAVLTGKNGKFTLPLQNRSGPYRIRFSKPGFNTVILHIKLSQHATQDLSVTLPFSAR